jgi:CSLREA domain-containing protein
VFRERRTALTVVAALACALTALWLPALAAAASQTFTVNGTGDTATKSNCEAGTGECTLRGAIEAANATTEADTIHFEGSPFDGESGLSTIVLGAALPTIAEPVEIDAGECPSAHYLVEGPCAEVDGSGLTNENDFTVEARLSSIRGIAVNGGKNGIVLGNGTELFFAANDWFGVQLDGFGGGASANAGVLMEPGAKNAVIGGETVPERNVFDESPVGVEIRGASKNQVQGNFIGLNPKGEFRHSLGIGVRIIDSTVPPAQAEFNEIGGARIEGSESKECSGACNAIATESAPGVGIELESATGPTTISGNYLGLKPDGSGPSESRSVEGVLAVPVGSGKPGPAEVTIGGSTPATEGNLFVEGEYGVKAEGAEALEVVGNMFGLTSDGEEIEDGRSLESAISVSSEGLAEGAAIESNSINAETSKGIESLFAGSEIVGNEIGGGAPGILTSSDTEGVGNLIFSNTVTEAATTGIRIKNSENVIGTNSITKAANFGVEIEGDFPTPFAEFNFVFGNVISEAGEIGIGVGSDATHNQIGGDGAGEANTITKSGVAGERDGAITILSRQEGRNEVAANTGSGNFGAFIKLISHSPGHEEPNGGIKPPAFATILQSSASGTAQPNAAVRIFSKASAETGELGGLLKVVEADAAGNWSASYATVGVGTLVTATQTSAEGGTSELAAAVAASADPSKPEEKKSDSGSGSSIPAPVTTTPPKAPKVKITAGPKKSSSATTAKFKFKAEPAAGAKFECKLGNARWAKCSSPKTYKKLKVGKHTFRVRATASGLTSSATVFKFTVKE